jgi:formate C-acetyltransferase
MNKRIKRLRQRSLKAKPRISLERALLLTRFYKSGQADKVSVPVARALAFKYLLEHKKLCINRGELIVGERGPAPKATPTYPEICTHTAQDLRILNSREKIEKISFEVSANDMKKHRQTIIPFWLRRSLRERLFAEMDREWICAYEAGVFTEFMEQRAPGHTVLDDKIYKKGFLEFIKEIELSIEELDFENDPSAFDKREQLRAMSLAADGILQA